MKISTRGRYGLRFMLDLAENAGEGYVPLREAAERQEISLKYLERILPVLVKAGYVAGAKGKGGGYRLVKDPGDYTVGDVLRLTEGDLAPVACLACDAEACDRASFCKTLPMWQRLETVLNDFFDSLTLADLLEGEANVRDPLRAIRT